MSGEKNPFVARELESAWQKEEDQSCYDLLALIPDGTNFRVRDLLLEMSSATIDEKELMQRSISEKKEFGFVRRAEERVILSGFEGGIDLDTIAGAVYSVAHPEKPAIFSHAHWDVKKHPLPGYAGIGFGDVPLFDFFIAQYPLLECRVSFNTGDSIRSIIYRGKAE